MSTAQEAAWIPKAIIGFFLFFMVLLSGLSWIAFHTYPGEATKDAYNKGLAYNTAIAGADAQAKLGWKSTLDVAPHANRVSIVFTLVDVSTRAISDANVIARFVRPTQAGHDVEAVLHYDNGAYRGQPQLDWPGVWDLHISATRGADNYQESKTITVQ